MTKEGAIQTAANMDESNIVFGLRTAMAGKLGNPARAVNDGDAAETNGARGKTRPGFMVALGTGGSCRTPSLGISAR